MVRAEVLRDLADGQACDEAAEHAAEQPQRLSFHSHAVPYEEDAQDHEYLKTGSHIGASVQGLMQVCPFLGAHGEQADDGGDDAAGGDDHRDHHGPDEVRAHEVAAQGPEGDGQDGGSQDGAGVALEEVSTHAGHIAYVIAHVVSDGSRVAGVILRDARLHLAHQVSAHIRCLGVDAAAHTGEERHGGSACGEALYHADVLVGQMHDLSGHIDARYAAEHQEHQPERKPQKGEGGHAEAHGEPAAEAHGERLRYAGLRSIGRARVRTRCHVHAHVPGSCREDAARDERKGRHPGERYGHHDGHHHHEDHEELVFAHEERLGALLDLDGDGIHLLGSGILFEDPASQIRREEDTDCGADGSYPRYCRCHCLTPFPQGHI